VNATAWGGQPLAPPTDAEFARFRTLIEREAGIYLADSKKPLLTARLIHRVRELGLSSFGAYLRYVLDEQSDERVGMLDRICTNETHFFREPHHFDLLAQRVVPRWVAAANAGRRPRRILAWSAGCATGEEPYSLAMALLAALPDPDAWEVSILATDLSTRALGKAEAAVYSAERAGSVPAAMRRPYLLRGVGSQRGNVKVAPEVRARVRFERLNLTSDSYRAGPALDLVFCRNVLIYFRADTRAQVIERMTGRLAADGLLFLGHAESLPPSGLPLRTVMPTVYQRFVAPSGRRS
jgi:chemotaxis protein methyltransferase CheR